MEIRKSFIFYSSYYEAISELSAEDQGQIYKAIIDYAIATIEPKNLTPVGKMCFKLIKPTIDAGLARHNASVENGSKGGRKKTQKKPSDNLDITQQEPSDNLDITQQEPSDNLNIDIDMDIDMDEDIESKKVSKKYINADAGARGCEQKKVESYEQIMDDLCVTHFGLRSALFELIRHCQLNKRMVTNEKLKQIIMRLDFTYMQDDVAKMKAVNKAINSGYFDIPELRDGI